MTNSRRLRKRELWVCDGVIKTFVKPKREAVVSFNPYDPTGYFIYQQV
jgi:hypothetical protein